MSPYSMQIAWSEEDEGFVGTCPEFPRVSALGGTYQEAASMLAEAIELAVETHEELGLPLPAPQLRSEYSGQLRVRLPRTVHGRLAEQAKRDGVSLNTLIVTRLAETLGQDCANAYVAATLQKTMKRFAVDILETKATLLGLDTYLDAGNESTEERPSSTSPWIALKDVADYGKVFTRVKDGV